MSQLTIYKDSDAKAVLFQSTSFAEICQHLAAIDVRFERWALAKALSVQAGNDEILAAYQDEIDQLVAERGYQSYDVVSMNADHPQKAEFRQKFLSEHIHSEDEVRFFVRGHGLFVMHVADKVYAMRCEKDDLISVPANTKHWFDMGPNPVFTAIRLFNNPDGWIAQFTGDDIAAQFPELDN